MNSLDSAFRSLFETNMGIAPGETVLVFSDRIRQDEAPSGDDRDRRQRLNASRDRTGHLTASRQASRIRCPFSTRGSVGAPTVG